RSPSWDPSRDPSGNVVQVELRQPCGPPVERHAANDRNALHARVWAPTGPGGEPSYQPRRTAAEPITGVNARQITTQVPCPLRAAAQSPLIVFSSTGPAP